MTAEYMLTQLLQVGEQMRKAQKGFFASKDPVEKRKHLADSKQLEKQFDNLLFNIKQLHNANNNQ